MTFLVRIILVSCVAFFSLGTSYATDDNSLSVGGGKLIIARESGSGDKKEMVRVPNIQGMCGKDADTLLRRVGLKPKGIPIHGPIESDAADIGCAYRQKPRAGTLVPKGTTVTYHYWWESG